LAHYLFEILRLSAAHWLSAGELAYRTSGAREASNEEEMFPLLTGSNLGLSGRRAASKGERGSATRRAPCKWAAPFLF